LIGMSETGHETGEHIASIRNPRLAGWACVSTYGEADGAWAYNQLFMIEIKPSAPAGDKFPNLGKVPEAQRPRIWRLAHTQNRYGKHDSDNAYFTEAFASIAHDGTGIYWGANWMGADNLEVYRLELPADWAERLTEHQ
jgi:hypothetical protein